MQLLVMGIGLFKSLLVVVHTPGEGVVETETWAFKQLLLELELELELIQTRMIQKPLLGVEAVSI